MMTASQSYLPLGPKSTALHGQPHYAAGGAGESCATTAGTRRPAGPALFITGIMAAIAAIEYIFAYRNVAYGIILSLALTFLLYLFQVIRPAEDELAACVDSLVLVPLYVLFTSSLPWFFIHQEYLLPAVYTCIIGLCMYHIYQKDLDLKELFGPWPGKDKILLYILLGTAIGVCTGLVEYLVLRIVPVHAAFSIKELVQNLVYMLLFVGLGEELLFRALIQKDLSRLFGWKWGLLGTAVLFSIMHLTWRSVPELFFVFIAGLIFGGLYIKTKSLFLPVLVHGINNTVLVAVYPYLCQALR
jgi:hypothetical protein